MTIPMVNAANSGYKSFHNACYLDIVYYDFLQYLLKA